MIRSLMLPVLAVLLLSSACGGGSSGGTAAQRAGVGAECSATMSCATYATADGGVAPLACLSFKGGYCGLQGCSTSADCPAGSICVTEGATNYCFLTCTDKSQCAANRPTYPANCSSSFTWAHPADNNGAKACIPPT